MADGAAGVRTGTNLRCKLRLRFRQNALHAFKVKPRAFGVALAQLSTVLHRVKSPVATIKDKTGFAVQFGMTYPIDLSAASDDDADDDASDNDDADQDAASDAQDPQTKIATKLKTRKPWEITHSFAWQLAYANDATLYLGYGMPSTSGRTLRSLSRKKTHSAAELLRSL